MGTAAGRAPHLGPFASGLSLRLSMYPGPQSDQVWTTVKQKALAIFYGAVENGFLLLLWWCPFKIQKEKRAGLQFTSTDYLALLLTPLRIRWTIPLSELYWLCLVKVTLRRYFQWSAILSVTLTLTFRNLSIPESHFSKHHGRRPSYGAKAISGIDEIPISYLIETEKCQSQFD